MSISNYVRRVSLAVPVLLLLPGLIAAENRLPVGVQTYIVTFSESNTMHYKGDIPSLSATTPETLRAMPMKKFGGDRYDVRMPQIVAYRQYLKQVQNAHIDAIKTRIGHDLIIRQTYDLTRSGIAIELTE